MSTNLPPVPDRQPMIVAGSGVPSPVWMDWFRKLFLRVGGLSAPTNDDEITTDRIANLAVTTGKIALGAVGLDQMSSAAKVGRVVQDVITLSGAVATGTTTIPFDDSIPQNTEGTEFMTVSITPQSSSNRLVIEAFVHLAVNTAGRYISGALFQDSTANALAAASVLISGNDGTTVLVLRHEMAAGTTSSTTFKFRAGPDNLATVTFNGAAGTRRFGGITVSSLRVTERVAA